jgi:protein disulfide-isomerase A6
MTGLLKHDSLSKFFDSVIDGTADLRILNEEAKQEEFVPDETLLEIERKQEAQRMALAHGGFADMVDFEEAIKQGHGADFHGKHGFPGMMGAMPKKKDEAPAPEESEKESEKVGESEEEIVEDPIHRLLRAQREAAEKSAKAPKMPKTGGGGADDKQETVWVPAPDSKQPRTGAPSGTQSDVPVEVTASAVSSQDVEESATSTVDETGPAETAHSRDEL